MRATDLDPETRAAFLIVQRLLHQHRLTLETDQTLVVVTGPDLDMKRGRERTLLGAVRDFLRANTAR